MEPPGKTKRAEQYVKEFGQYEKSLIANVKDKLICPNNGCKMSGTALNAGKQGNKNQAGYSLSSITCNALKGCGCKARIPTWLVSSNLHELKDEYEAKIAKTNESIMNGGIIQSKLNFKRKHDSSEAEEMRPTQLPRSVDSDKDIIIPDSQVISQGKDQAEASQFQESGNHVSQPGTVEVSTAPSAVDPSSLENRVKELENRISLIDKLQEENSRLKIQVVQLQAALARNQVNNSAPVTDTANLNHENPPISSAPAPNTQPTYASVARTNVPPQPKKRVLNKKTARRISSKMFAERSDPVEFEKIHIKINDNRALKRCRNMRESNELIRNALVYLGVKKSVTRFSKIGNSILELYVPAALKQDVVEQLALKNTTLVRFNPKEIPVYCKAETCKERTANRLYSLISRKGTFMNLKKSILSGHFADVIDMVEAKIAARDIIGPENPANFLCGNAEENTDEDILMNSQANTGESASDTVAVEAPCQ